MNPFMPLIILFAILAALVGQNTVAAMPLAVRRDSLQPEQLDEIPIQRATSPFLPHDTTHRLVLPVPEAPVHTEPTPPLYPINAQTGNTETMNSTSNGSFAETHPASIIAIFTFLPFAACIVFYPVFIWLRRRREAARLAREAAMDKTREKKSPSPVCPDSPYLNNPRLQPLPTHPEMVYVPPTKKEGMSPIFGHFRSSSGSQVYGVEDRWVFAERGAVHGVKLKGSSESLLVREI